MQINNLVYTNIQHQPRKKWGLSLNEYVLCDMIYHLSNNPQYNWCIMSKETMANELWLSKRWILNILDELIEKWWILKDPTTKFLKTTENWYIEFITYSEKSAPVVQTWKTSGEKSAPHRWKKCTKGGEKSAHNNNIDNNIDNNIIYIDDTFINSKILEFIKNRKQLKKPMTDLAIEKLVEKTKNWMASQKNETIAQWFDRAIECWWQWVFEQKAPQQWNFIKQPAKKLAYEWADARKEFAF